MLKETFWHHKSLYQSGECMTETQFENSAVVIEYVNNMKYTNTINNSKNTYYIY